MQIEMIKLSDLKPYEKNPRINNDSVDFVANSIRDFGFKVPIVIDNDNVIICGHTRYKASKKLKLKEVPCIRADDLTEEQVKAYRLADNKVSENSLWDFQLLGEELIDIDLDMGEYGFIFQKEEPTQELPKENERQRTNDAYNLGLYDCNRTEGAYDMPIIRGIDYEPKDLIGFNYAKSSDEYHCGIHFFIDDYQFERLWNSPNEYIEILTNYDCMLTPDFSLYMDMPIAMQIYNIYRSRLIGQLYQDYGMRVIPTASWSDERSFEFCFDGLPSNATIAISTVGVMNADSKQETFKKGLDELIKRKNPKTLILYGKDIEYDFGNINVVRFKNKITSKWGE